MPLFDPPTSFPLPLPRPLLIPTTPLPLTSPTLCCLCFLFPNLPKRLLLGPLTCDSLLHERIFNFCMTCRAGLEASAFIHCPTQPSNVAFSHQAFIPCTTQFHSQMTSPTSILSPSCSAWTDGGVSAIHFPICLSSLFTPLAPTRFTVAAQGLTPKTHCSAHLQCDPVCLSRLLVCSHCPQLERLATLEGLELGQLGLKITDLQSTHSTHSMGGMGAAHTARYSMHSTGSSLMVQAQHALAQSSSMD